MKAGELMWYTVPAAEAKVPADPSQGYYGIPDAAHVYVKMVKRGLGLIAKNSVPAVSSVGCTTGFMTGLSGFCRRISRREAILRSNSQGWQREGQIFRPVG